MRLDQGFRGTYFCLLCVCVCVCVCVCAGVGPLEVALSFFIFLYCTVEHSHLCVQLRYFHSVLLDAGPSKKQTQIERHDILVYQHISNQMKSPIYTYYRVCVCVCSHTLCPYIDNTHPSVSVTVLLSLSLALSFSLSLSLSSRIPSPWRRRICQEPPYTGAELYQARPCSPAPEGNPTYTSTGRGDINVQLAILQIISVQVHYQSVQIDSIELQIKVDTSVGWIKLGRSSIQIHLQGERRRLRLQD